MTKVTTVLRGFGLVAALMVAFAASGSARAGVSVLAVGSELTEAGGVATARFKIQVENGSDADVANVRVVFAGGIEVALGDVAAGAKVVSAAQKFTFDAADLSPTKNVPVGITLKCLADGVETSTPALLIIRRAE